MILRELSAKVEAPPFRYRHRHHQQQRFSIAHHIVRQRRRHRRHKHNKYIFIVMDKPSRGRHLDAVDGGWMAPRLQ